MLDLEEFAYGWWRVPSLKFRSTLPDPPPPPGSTIFLPKHIPDEDPIITTPQTDPPPTQEVWLYAPDLGTAIGAPYVANGWQFQRPDVDTGFPSNLFTVVSGNIQVPDTGSFRVTCRTYFTKFIVTTYNITACYMRVVFTNCIDPPIEIHIDMDITDTTQFLEVTRGRTDIPSAKINPLSPLTMHMEIRCDGTTGLGGGNIFPAANDAYGGNPFRPGDANLIVDWWP
jgi:hypothetical protein